MTQAILILLVSGGVLLIAAHWLVNGIIRIAQHLRWKEFVLAFFVMSVGGSLPNLFVGIVSAARDIPELSFGDVVGNSVTDLSLVVAIAALVGGRLSATARLTQTTGKFVLAAAIFPLLLILDGVLGRGDALALFLLFAAYSVWLFSRRKEKNSVMGADHETPKARSQALFHALWRIVLGMVFMAVAAEGIVRSAATIAGAIGVSIVTIGVLGIGLGNALPEIYFAITAARKKHDKLVLGELMGSVVVLTTLVLGVVAFIHPITIPDFSPFIIARFFLIAAAFFFLIFVRTGRSITRKEAWFLLALYLVFVATEIGYKTLQ